MFTVSELLRPPVKLRERALLVRGGGLLHQTYFSNENGKLQSLISSDTHTRRIKLETGSLSHVCVYLCIQLSALKSKP